ncbi:electron transfer flavoprotein subunit beta/FixA family protein [Parafrigoribacterium mesophilum]|uniref:electron transfer flavoprotein subunit beta/FixA family protein n=1 Tax=Parafrigoribacterium mesophilum TaxID=433646 RepID=UPI0031FC1E07
MKIVVLVKQVPDTGDERRLDPASGRLDRSAGTVVLDEINERALEAALSYKDSHKDTSVTVLSMGPEGANGALRTCLAMGADAAVHVVDDGLAGADLVRTSVVLAAAVTRLDFDLVIAGNESTDGRGGVVPAMVAAHLGVPMLGSLSSVDIDASQVSGEQGTEYGSASLRASLPAIISVTEGFAEGRFPSFKGIMTAKKKPLTKVPLSELGIDPAAFDQVGRSSVLSTQERPARVAGTKIIDAGEAGVELAEFLASRRLI